MKREISNPNHGLVDQECSLHLDSSRKMLSKNINLILLLFLISVNALPHADPDSYALLLKRQADSGLDSTTPDVLPDPDVDQVSNNSSHDAVGGTNHADTGSVTDHEELDLLTSETESGPVQPPPSDPTASDSAGPNENSNLMSDAVNSFEMPSPDPMPSNSAGPTENPDLMSDADLMSQNETEVSSDCGVLSANDPNPSNQVQGACTQPATFDTCVVRDASRPQCIYAGVPDADLNLICFVPQESLSSICPQVVGMDGQAISSTDSAMSAVGSESSAADSGDLSGSGALPSDQTASDLSSQPADASTGGQDASMPTDAGV